MTAAIGSAITKAVKYMFSRWRGAPSEAFDPSRLCYDLRDEISKAHEILDEVQALFPPEDRRYELGVVVMLAPAELERYQRLRERLLGAVLSMDELTQELMPGLTEDATVPDELSREVRFIEKRLKDARTASFAEDTFLNLQSALDNMERLVDRLERRFG